MLGRLKTRSLATPLLGVYLAFVSIVLVAGAAVSLFGQHQLREGIQSADLALAQAIALDTDDRLRLVRDAVVALASLEPIHEDNFDTIRKAFKAFKAARPEVDRVYVLNREGLMQISEPFDVRTLGTDFSEQPIFLRAKKTTNVFVEAGVVDLTTYNPVAVIVQPIYGNSGEFIGALAANLSLDDLSAPLQTIVADQAKQNARVQIHILDVNGTLIASAQRERLLQNMRSELPVAALALRGLTDHQMANDWRGESWLYSAAPVPVMGWAVVVQRLSVQALQPIANFNNWLTVAAILFGLVGVLFWLALSRRVIKPLQTLSKQHGDQFRSLQITNTALQFSNAALNQRNDEIGELARSLARLESDVNARLTELHELLQASSTVVSTLDPSEVAIAIIRAARQLVDAQAAAVLVPDEDNRLRVLASEGRSKSFDDEVNVSLDDKDSPSAQALRDGKPVQLVSDTNANFSSRALQEGFHTVLTIPIISRHAGAVVLVVHRVRPQMFSSNEIDLLLTLANYAMLGWEHAKLYERSDIRLRAERQTLAAIMRSMDEGLVLADENSSVIYANRAASAMVGLTLSELERADMQQVQQALRDRSGNATMFDKQYALLSARGETQIDFTAPTFAHTQTLSLRAFNVRDDDENVIGKGLLLRDVTREQEVDRFRSALLAAVSHEVRTPLAAIKGNASSLLMNDITWSASEQRHIALSINDETDRLAQVLNNLLDLSRSEAGALQLHRQPQHMHEIIRRALERVDVKRESVQVECDIHLPQVDVDAARIEIVLVNLLSNAVAYGNGKMCIAARMRTSDPNILIQISDNGLGIAPEDLPHIFERFYRASSGKQRRVGGSGLGLAICRAFVEAHGGKIWATSDASGTTITFTVPIYLQPALPILSGEVNRA
jgi:PAS domain S-box-containing protein